MGRARTFGLGLLINACLCVAPASAIPIDFASFDIVDPTVTIFGPTSSSAELTEDEFLSPVSLLQFELSVPTDATELAFEYLLNVPAGNEDFFDFFLGDLSVPLLSFGGAPGTFGGSLSNDVRASAGGVLPVAFTLAAGFGDFAFDSVLTVTEARFVTSAPEPGLLGFLSSMFLCLVSLRSLKKGT